MLGGGKVIDIATEQTVQFVKVKWNYIRKYKNYVRDLDGERERLEVAREGLEHEVEDATNNGGIIEKEVTVWLKDAEKSSNDARDVQEKKKQKSCFRGSIIVNPYIRYRIGKDAKELTDFIQQLETRKNGLRRLSYRSAPGKVTGLHRGISYYVTPSRDAILSDINKALMDSDVKAVGVYGRSGVGKSTLIRQMEEQVHRKLLNYDFDEVAMATVSRNPDYEKIQGELAYGLGLKFENETDVDQKANRLHDRLSQEKKILIILDDIWKKLELDKLGIRNDNKGIKLFLTSRSKETLKNEMNCGQYFQLKAFSKEEAIELFKGIVGRQIEDELLELVGKRIVEEDACLPIYIVPLATKLKTYAPSTWEKALNGLTESNKLGVNKLISEALVDGEVNKLFLLCGKIGNQIILIEDLLFYGIGLGLFQGINTIEECRERLKRLLENLKSFCFLEDYGDDYVKIHDVMSEASLSMALKTEHSLVLRDEKQLRAQLEKSDALRECKSISLPFVSDITGGLLERLKCPGLDIFLLYMEENCQIQFPNLLFEGMKELKVLDIFGKRFTSLPSSILDMKELRTLCLDHCQIADLKIVGQLEKLQVLKLSGSKFVILPQEVGKLIDLRLLDLRNCYDLQLIEHGALGSLVKLEELYLPENYGNWEAAGVNRASLHELTGMTCLTSLTICVPNLTDLPHDFPFANLKRYKIVIKGLHIEGVERGSKINPKGQGKPSTQSDKVATKDYFIEYDKTRTLRLKLDKSDRIFLENWVQTSLHSAQNLELLGWRGYEKSITELSKQDFSELKHVVIQNSPGIQYIFRPKDHFSSALMELLHLERLINLERIYQGNLPTNSFINLKILRVRACHNLRNLLSSSLAKALSRIREIEVSNCKNLSDIVELDVVGHMEPKKGGDLKFEVLESKCLQTLVLSGLPKISSFCGKEKRSGDNDDTSPVAFLDGRQVSFPSLESLVMSELEEVRKIFDGKFPVKLQRLRLLKIKSCSNLSNVLEINLRLKNLEALTIESCRSVKTIFNLERLNQGEAIKFKSLDLAKLMKLKLVDLPSLNTIWPNIKEGSLMRNLNQLEVSQCHELTHLFSSVMIKSLQKISQISVDNCKKMKRIVVEENDSEDIEDTIGFSSLTELRMSNMDSLAMFAYGKRTFNFPHLKKLEIRNCSKMNTFVQLKDEFEDESSSCIEKLAARSCHKIGKFFPLKVATTLSRTEQDDDGTNYESFFNIKVILPNLKKLVLSSLGRFESIWQSFPSDNSFCKLASIQIEKCNSLKILVLPEHGQQDLNELTSSGSQLENVELMRNSSRKPVLGFPFLTNFKIDECNELRSLFPDAIARTLFELRDLHISSCRELVNVVSIPIEEMMMFYKLCSLKLKDLQELESFSTGSVEYYFPFLNELWISGCTNMKAFIMSSSSSIDATPLFHDKAIIPNLEKLHIEGLELEEIFSPGLSCKLKDLEVEACHRLSIVIPSFMFPNMQSLESLTVKDCNSVKMIFSFDGFNFLDRKLYSRKSWKLKTMKLYCLPWLENIWQNKTFSEYFPFSNLDFLEVQSCKLLRNIFEVSTTKILEKLQQLLIDDCPLMDQVVEYGGDCSTGGTTNIILHQLSFLKFSKLPRLSSFCKKHMTEWPSLANMEVKDCGTMEAFAADSKQHFEPLFLLEKVAFPKLESLTISGMKNMKELWNIGTYSECSSEAFSKLKKIEMERCEQILTIFPSKMVKGFMELEKLSVVNCRSLKQVFQVQDLERGSESNDNNTSIPIPFSLRDLSLDKLPAMDHVWNIESSEGINLKFEKLREIRVQLCDSLKYIFPSSAVRYSDQLYLLEITSCKDMEEIVQKKVNRRVDNYDDSQHHQFVPRDLKVNFLELKDLPNLKSNPCKNYAGLLIIGCPRVKIPGGGGGGGGSDIINPAQKDKVNIPTSLKVFTTDREGLQEMQHLDNLIDLRIQRIDEAAAKRFPWKLLLERSHNLQMLRVRNSKFKGLFLLTDEEEAEEDKEIAPYGRYNNNPKLKNTHFQSLRELRLDDLPELKRVWREASVMEEILQVVENLKVYSCCSLTHLFQAPASFSNLTQMDIFDCKGMIYLLTSSAARCLQQLTTLEIENCENMEEIVREDESLLDGNGGANVVCFPRLRVVQLKWLSKLTSFCSSDCCKFEFLSLESVSLWGVDELEAFCQGGFEAPLLLDVDVPSWSADRDETVSRLKIIMELEQETEVDIKSRLAADRDKLKKYTEEVDGASSSRKASLGRRCRSTANML